MTKQELIESRKNVPAMKYETKRGKDKTPKDGITRHKIEHYHELKQVDNMTNSFVDF